MDKDISSFMKTCRKNRGLTQVQIAQRLNLSQTTINMFENGANNNAEILLYYLFNVLTPGQVEVVREKYRWII